jgi:hypothetical protein
MLLRMLTCRGKILLWQHDSQGTLQLEPCSHQVPAQYCSRWLLSKVSHTKTVDCSNQL